MKNIFIISGSALKSARTAVKPKITQGEVADALGIERTTYTNWEGKQSIEIDKSQLEILKKVLKVAENVLTIVPHETNEETDLLDNPLVKSLVKQSDYILKRVSDLEMENEKLRKRLGE